MDLSIVVPVYNKERTIKREILGITKELRKSGISYEIIAVVDGGESKSLRQLRHLKELRVFELAENHGKGYAVCFGMKKARGGIISFIDAGGEYKPSLLVFFWHFMNATEADIIVGSKMHPASYIPYYPMVRRILSLGYQLLTRVLFGLWVRDTQAGIKMLRATVVHKVAPRLLVKSYAFDVELLAVSSHLGFNKIYEAPITLEWKGGWGLSSKKIWLVIVMMLWDTLSVFYRIRIKKYYDRKK